MTYSDKRTSEERQDIQNATWCFRLVLTLCAQIITFEQMEFAFDEAKNERLFQLRGVTFQMVIEAIEEKGVLLNFNHPNQQKYPNQKVLVVNINDYAYCVPYEIEGNRLILKTIYPSRKFKHLIRGKANE
jgi:uncharacterized DUF497 family protein